MQFASDRATLLYGVLAMLLATGISVPSSQAVSKAAGVSSQAVANANHKEYAAVLEQGPHGFPMSLFHSKTPRDWVAFSQMLGENNSGGDAATALISGAFLRKAAEAAPQDRVAQAYWANALTQFSGCDKQNPCPDRTMAWATLEPDNSAAWLAEFNAHWMMKAVPAADAILDRMAHAARYDDSTVDAFKMWKEVFLMVQWPKQSRLKSHASNSQFAAELAYQRIDYIPRWGLLVKACDRSKQLNASELRFESCGKIGRQMMNQSSTFVGRGVGAALLRKSGTGRSADFPIGRAAQWQSYHFGNRKVNKAAEYLSFLADFEATGSEVAATQVWMRREGVSLMPPAHWQRTRDGKPIGPLGELLTESTSNSSNHLSP